MLKNRVERLEAKTETPTEGNEGLSYDGLKIFYCNPSLNKLYGNSSRSEADVVLVGMNYK